MGDRGNIAVQDGGKRVYFYSHWSGSELPAIVQKALRRQQRWDDAPYLARIIFNTMTEGCSNSETGFGISTDVCDNEHPIVVVDCDTKKVRFEPEDAQVLDADGVSFADYIALASVGYPDTVKTRLKR